MAAPCPPSADSVSVIDSCPLTWSEWNNRAKVKNCSMYPQTCFKPLEYHCMLNPYGNESLEVCAPNTWLAEDFCPSYNINQKRILEQRNCASLLPDCPTRQYFSNTILNHKECLKELSTSSTTSEDSTMEDIISWLIPVVLLFIAVGAAIIIWKKVRKRKGCFEEEKDHESGALRDEDKNDSNQRTPLFEQTKTSESLKETNEEILKKRIYNQGATEKHQGEDIVVSKEKKSSSTEDSNEKNDDETSLAQDNSHDEARVCLPKIDDFPQKQHRKETQDDTASVITLDAFLQQTRQEPCKRNLKVQVVARDAEFSYKNKHKEDKVLVNCAIADSSKAVKCTVYDPSKFEQFAEGESLILRNVIKNPDGIVVTTYTKVFRTSEVKVSQEFYEQGRHILNPPPPPVKTVEEALASPPKIRVSVKGKVVQVEAVQEVKEERVKVKNILIEDSTSKCNVALWGTLADEEIRAGDYVYITDVVTTNFRKEISLKTTYRTKICKT